MPEPARPPLSRLFDPRSIAVVGASAAPEKAGFQMLKTVLSGFSGPVYPVNPGETRILGRTAYPDLAAIPDAVDLVILALPPRFAPAILSQAAETGAGAALVVSGGFAEAGADGRRLQDEILAICRDGGLRLLGPNTSGFIRPPRDLHCIFLPSVADIAAGGVAIVAQSGGVNLTLAFLADMEGLGVSFAAGLGNAADVGMAEVVDYLAGDADTRVIALHLEGVDDGRALYDAVARASAAKPVVALPVGRADLGGFAESHTGRLIGDFRLTRAALVQAGAVIVDTTTELIDAATALSGRRLPAAEDPGVGILASQAGPGLLMTDRLRGAGVSVPEIGAPARERIAGLLPPMHFVRNPVDTGRPSESYGEILTTLVADPAVDALLIYALLEDDNIDPVAEARGALGATDGPVLYGTCGPPRALAPVRAALQALGVPAFAAPDRAARGMQALVEDARAAWRRTRNDAPPPATPTALPPGAMDEAEAKAMIAAAGIAVPRGAVCETHDDAHAALRSLPGAVAVKILDAAVTHKTDAGGVRLGINSAAALNAALAAIDAIPTGGPKRYLVELMAPPGIEVIVGGANDASFGPTVLLGLGGTAAEALGDVAIRLAPVGRAEAADMIDALRGSTLFDGWRGAPAIDRAALIDAIVAVAGLVAANPAIREIDLNPVRLYPDGLMALDALVVT